MKKPLEVIGLSKTYNTKEAVKDVSFKVNQNEIIGILGPNGCGKTTTIAMMLGLLKPSNGRVVIHGLDIEKNRISLLHKMNFISPYIELPKKLSVKENLIVYGKLYGVKFISERIEYLSKKLNYKVVLDGVNLDDLKDYRPGIEAAKKAGVVSPLAKFKFSKQDVRDISKALGFPWWDKPAQPCLSSRFPYGHEITSERLKMVEKAEEYLKEGGLSEVRVRCQGSTARIEIPQNELKHFFNNYNFKELVKYFSNLGFECTSLDLEGLISGKLNR